jgi:hypothetical protein
MFKVDNLSMNEFLQLILYQTLYLYSITVTNRSYLLTHRSFLQNYEKKSILKYSIHFVICCIEKKINQLTCFVKTKFDLPKIDQMSVQNEKNWNITIYLKKVYIFILPTNFERY